MRTFVTCCTNSCIGGFIRLAEQFYKLPLTIDYVPRHVFKSDQLIALCDSVQDDYFILLEDDFYFIEPVNVPLINWVFEYCQRTHVDRFSLQTRNAHMVSTWTPTNDDINGNTVYLSNPSIVIPFSLEASVWNRKFLCNNLLPGLNDSEIETQVSKQIRKRSDCRICALDKSIMSYMDASRDGQQVIHVTENPFQLNVSLDRSK